MFAVILACGCAFAATGCSENKVRAAAPAIAPTSAEAQRPMNTAPDTDASPPVEAAVPPAVPASSAQPPIAISPVKPPAPRKPSEQQPAEEAEQTAHPAAPQISPQLSPGDQATYERRTGDDIAIAERNLGQTSGKQLNAAQQDLVEKIRSFVSQSRDASKGGDWSRAQNLAQKARLLSDELLNSL